MADINKTDIVYWLERIASAVAGGIVTKADLDNALEGYVPKSDMTPLTSSEVTTLLNL